MQISVEQVVYNGQVERVCVDITDPAAVGIEIRQDGNVVWVNVDGYCVLRINRPKILELRDNREPSSAANGPRSGES